MDFKELINERTEINKYIGNILSIDWYKNNHRSYLQNKNSFEDSVFAIHRISKMLSATQRKLEMVISNDKLVLKNGDKIKNFNGPIIFLKGESHYIFHGDDECNILDGVDYIYIPDSEELDENGHFLKWYFIPNPEFSKKIISLKSVTDSISIILKDRLKEEKEYIKDISLIMANKNYDYREKLDYGKIVDNEFSDKTEYNEFLDPDQQDPDFWNQF